MASCPSSLQGALRAQVDDPVEAATYDLRLVPAEVLAALEPLHPNLELLALDGELTHRGFSQELREVE